MQHVKDLVLSLQWLWSLLWHRFDPWPRNFHMPGVRTKKKKKERKKTLAHVYCKVSLKLFIVILFRIANSENCTNVQ